MKASLLALSLLGGWLVGGCAVPQPPALASAPTHVRMDAIATLATNDCEAGVAAEQTAVIVARRRAAAELRAQRIGVAEAERVQRVADQARAALDQACPAGKPDATQLAAARAAIAQLTGARHAN